MKRCNRNVLLMVLVLLIFSSASTLAAPKFVEEVGTTPNTETSQDVVATLGQSLEKAPAPAPKIPAPSPLDLPITKMSFVQEEILNVYWTLGTLAGWNVLGTADDVSGPPVTLVLEDASLGAALDKVDRLTGYMHYIDGNTLVVASPERMKDYVPTVAVFIPVRNIDPSTAKSLIEGSVRGVEVVVDQKTQQLLVKGMETQVEAASAIIARYDVALKQRYDFENMPVSEILRQLAKSAGINVLIDGSINVTLSIILSDKTPLEAFDIVVKQAGLVKETSPEGFITVKKLAVAQEPVPPTPVAEQQAAAQPAKPQSETRILRVKYITVDSAKEVLAAALPALQLKALAASSTIAATGVPSDLDAAQELLTWQDFPEVTVSGIVRIANGNVATMKVAGKLVIVREGDAVGELNITAISPQGVTVRLGEREEFIPVGGAR